MVSRSRETSADWSCPEISVVLLEQLEALSLMLFGHGDVDRDAGASLSAAASSVSDGRPGRRERRALAVRCQWIIVGVRPSPSTTGVVPRSTRRRRRLPAAAPTRLESRPRPGSPRLNVVDSGSETSQDQYG